MPDRVTMTIDITTFNARIHRYIQASGREADATVLEIATEVLADTVEAWPVDSGASRAAWWGPTRIAPASYQIGNPYVYAKLLEYGGYEGVGPKTVRFGGTTLPGGQNINAGIYSSQVPAAPSTTCISK